MQDFVVQEDKKEQFAVVMGDLHDDEEGEGGNQSELTSRKQGDSQTDRDKTQKHKSQKQKKMEPSLKWKNLGMEEQKQYVSQKCCPHL